MSWTPELEEKALVFWFEAKSKFDKMMKKESKKRQWILAKLKEYCQEKGEIPQWLCDFTDKQLKNKLDYMRKLGTKTLRELVHPRIKPKTLPTGSAYESDDDSQKETLSDTEWEAIIDKCKWRPIRTYYNLFRAHPTMGFGFSLDTVKVADHEYTEGVDGTPPPVSSSSSASSIGSSSSSGPGTAAPIAGAAKVTGPTKLATPTKEAIDDWNSSSSSESDLPSESDTESLLKPLPRKRKHSGGQTKTKEDCKKRVSPEKKFTPVALPDGTMASPQKASPHGASSTARRMRLAEQAELAKTVMEAATAGQHARTADQASLIQKENRKQREHEIMMAERAEKHSAMLQRQAAESAARLQETSEKAQKDRLEAMMGFQAQLLKNLFKGE